MATPSIVLLSGTLQHPHSRQDASRTTDRAGLRSFSGLLSAEGGIGIERRMRKSASLNDELLGNHSRSAAIPKRYSVCFVFFRKPPGTKGLRLLRAGIA
jgi:hypothetical protein